MIASEPITQQDVQRAQQKKQQLSAELTAARHELIRLCQQRGPFAQERLARLVHGRDVPADVTNGLAAIDVEVVRLESEIKPLADAFDHQCTEIARLQRALQVSNDEKIHDRTATLYAELRLTLVQLAAQVDELVALHQRRPAIVPLVIHQPTVVKWLQAVQHIQEPSR
jgi:chromosome segregation ATPase